MRGERSRWLVVVIVAVVAGCTGEVSGPENELIANMPPPAGDLSATEQALLDAINAARGDNGVGEVVAVDDLTCAARAHSQDIGERGACTHTGDDGSSPGDRVDRCSGDGWSGEIVACGQGSPTAAVEAWLDSPGHNAIMLDPGQLQVGVAMHNNFWTAIFDR